MVKNSTHFLRVIIRKKVDFNKKGIIAKNGW